MPDIERHTGLLKLNGGQRSLQDLQHVFSSVDYAKAQGYDTQVDQLFLTTKKPLRIDFNSAQHGSMMTEVLDESSAPALATMELAEMLGDNPTPGQAHMRDRLGLAQGMVLEDRDREMLTDVLAETLRGLGGLAVISGDTVEGLTVVRGFYEDTRTIDY